MVMIRSEQEWWDIIENNWSVILALFNKFLPALYEHIDLDGEVLSEMLLEKIIKLKEDHNNRLAMYVQATWVNAPESHQVNRIKGWQLLCDLKAFDWSMLRSSDLHWIS